MSHLLKEFRGSIDLIYIDPPFDSKAEYKKEIQLKGKRIVNDRSVFEEKQYTDIWVVSLFRPPCPEFQEMIFVIRTFQIIQESRLFGI